MGKKESFSEEKSWWDCVPRSRGGGPGRAGQGTASPQRGRGEAARSSRGGVEIITHNHMLTIGGEGSCADRSGLRGVMTPLRSMSVTSCGTELFREGKRSFGRHEHKKSSKRHHRFRPCPKDFGGAGGAM